MNQRKKVAVRIWNRIGGDDPAATFSGEVLLMGSAIAEQQLLPAATGQASLTGRASLNPGSKSTPARRQESVRKGS
jgi:hypothetical protein